MALVNRSFSVNVTPGMMPPIVHVSEYDVGRAYTVSIIDEQGNTFTIPSGTTASIEGTLNGSVGFTQSATVSNNQVSFTLSESMTAYSGNAWCKIKLTQNSQPIQTCAFVLAVDRAGVEAETVIGALGFEEQIADAVADYLDESGLVIDATLSQSGSAADAKATGDAIAAVEDQIEAITSGITPIVYETVANSYVRANTGEINSYSGWSRTDYIPVTAGESINYSNGNATQYCWYYKTDKTPLSQFDLSVTQDGSLTVPENAAWMIVSDTTAGMASKRFWRTKSSQQDLDGMLLTTDIKNAILSLFSYVAYSTPSAQSTYNTLANLFSGSGGGGGDSGGGGGDGWTSGVAYANVTIVQGEYVKGSGSSAGQILTYAGWDRTDYLPCAGASTIVVPACPQTYTGNVNTNAFYDSTKTFISTFEISKTQSTTVQVPINAAYFILSSESAPLATCVGNGITPYS